MLVVIRTDSSLETGSGHTMRCLALADLLRDRGASVHFICRPAPGDLNELVRSQGFEVSLLDPARGAGWRDDARQTAAFLIAMTARPDWLVVDHYGLASDWEASVRPLVKGVMVIEDLADRTHDCDLLLDQNLHPDSSNRYDSLVPAWTRLFVGPQYALIRGEFDSAGKERTRDGRVQHLLVYLGGGDSIPPVLEVLKALRAMPAREFDTTVVLGHSRDEGSSVAQAASDLPRVSVLGATDRMAQLMETADLAIGACGVAAWERCVVGLPSIVVVTAENQRDDAEALHERGAVINLGDASTLSASRFAEALEDLCARPDRVRSMSRAATEVMQGRRAAVLELLEALDGK